MNRRPQAWGKQRNASPSRPGDTMKRVPWGSADGPPPTRRLTPESRPPSKGSARSTSVAVYKEHDSINSINKKITRKRFLL